MLARIEQQRQESVRENKEKGGAELISKTISQKTIWIGGNPGLYLRLSKVTNKWNKRFNAGKSRGVRGISPDAAIFLIYRRFAPFHRSVPSPLLLPLLRCFETREISAIQNTTLGFLIK